MGQGVDRLGNEGVSLVTVQETIEMLESDGWQLELEAETLRQFRHESKPGILTISGRPDLPVPKGVLRNLRLAALLGGD